MRGYSTQEVAELIDLPESIIREIARGVLDPTRAPNQQFRFNFQDIVLLRTAKELMDTGVRRSKINRSLFELQQKLPPNRPLTSLRITGDGGEVVVREDAHIYNPQSGQLHFNFSISDLAGSVAPLAIRAAAQAQASGHLCSDDWYDLGMDLEAVSPDDAPAAYLRALALTPEHADAHYNLSRLFELTGKHSKALEHLKIYRALTNLA